MSGLAFSSTADLVAELEGRGAVVRCAGCLERMACCRCADCPAEIIEPLVERPFKDGRPGEDGGAGLVTLTAAITRRAPMTPAQLAAWRASPAPITRGEMRDVLDAFARVSARGAASLTGSAAGLAVSARLLEAARGQLQTMGSKLLDAAEMIAAVLKEKGEVAAELQAVRSELAEARAALARIPTKGAAS